MKFNYNWDNYPLVLEYLKKIYFNTVAYLEDNDYNIEYANEFLNDMEDFFYYFKVNNYNVNNIIFKISNIETIEFYDSLFVGLEMNNTPLVLNRGDRILLNTSISGNDRLSSKERRRLYLYQGLMHSILSFRSEKTVTLSRNYSRYLGRNASLTESIVNNGWGLLEDTLAQELAEKITYYCTNKLRPGYRPGMEDEKYNISGHKISSNLEDYRFSQELLVRFGLTTGKMGSMFNYSDNNVLDDIINFSINYKFSDLVINEYSKKGMLLELYQMLYLMGILVNEKYRTYSMHYIREKELSIEEIDAIYDKLIELMNELISFRNENRYDNIDYSNVTVLYDENEKKKILNLVQNKEI